MLDRIRNLFMDRGGAPAEGAHHSQDELQLAAAALLVEAACMDDDFDSEERATVQRLLAERFGMFCNHNTDEVPQLKKTPFITSRIMLSFIMKFCSFKQILLPLF